MTDLHEEFLADHRNLIRGIDAIRRALEKDDLRTARQLAEELDLLAGPHIEFEEQHFYPSLEPILGPERIREFYDEHRAGREAIAALCSAPDDSSLDRDVIAEGLDTMAAHALTCGTLTSHAQSFDEATRRDLLAKLRELRSSSQRWTELEHAR